MWQHLDSVGVAPLPKRNSNQALRISSLHQVFFFPGYFSFMLLLLHRFDQVVVPISFLL